MLYTEQIIGLNYLFFLPFAIGLFVVGLIGIVFNEKSLLILMLCIELMFLGISFTFIIFSLLQGSYLGELYALLVLTVAAAESAIGLGLLVVSYRVRKSISFSSFNELRG
jgi:NADH-quinone oxidoreductase subunit K